MLFWAAVGAYTPGHDKMVILGPIVDIWPFLVKTKIPMPTKVRGLQETHHTLHTVFKNIDMNRRR